MKEKPSDPGASIRAAELLRTLGLPQDALLHNLLAQVAAQAESFDRPDEPAQGGLPNGLAKQSPSSACGCRPFLSILMRTQGKRPQALREALLCLCAQSCQDYEVLLLGHRLGDAQRELVDAIVAETPPGFRRMIRPIAVEEGGRAAPLNAGLSQMRGRYFAVLDDDDIAFDNWVERFATAAQEQPGAVLHAYALRQDWRQCETPEGQALMACGEPENLYCAPFDAVRQLWCNNCPTGALAFPAFLYATLGMRYDDTLSTTEDWDFLMRAAFVCGVHDIPCVTFLYRTWVDGGNSKSAHSEVEWERNYQAVVAGFDRGPVLLPPGTATKITKLYGQPPSGGQGKGEEEQCALYIGSARGFREEDALHSHMRKTQTGFTCQFEGLEHYDDIAALRFDPQEDGGLLLEGLQMEVALSDGETLRFGIDEVETNGYRSGKHILFLRSDPQVVLKPGDLGGRSLREVRVSGSLSRKLFHRSMDEALAAAIDAFARPQAVPPTGLKAKLRARLRRALARLRR